MKIFVIEDYSGEGFWINETAKNASTVARNVDETLDHLRRTDSETLVLITDSEPSVFYALYEKIHRFNHPVKLLLLNHSKRYFMLGNNSADKTIFYHAS